MVKNRSVYKHIKRKERVQYDIKHPLKLEEGRFKKCQGVLEITARKSSNLNVPHFENYIKAINNPDSVFFSPMILFCLFKLMLYVHGKQLRSCRDGPLSYPHCSRASLPEAGYQYIVHIFSSLTDKCSS